MHILWTKNRIAEQVLEGQCNDISKLQVQILGTFIVGRSGTDPIMEDRLLEVRRVESHSDGILKIVVDIPKETP